MSKSHMKQINTSIGQHFTDKSAYYEKIGISQGNLKTAIDRRLNFLNKVLNPVKLSIQIIKKTGAYSFCKGGDIIRIEKESETVAIVFSEETAELICNSLNQL